MYIFDIQIIAYKKPIEKYINMEYTAPYERKKQSDTTVTIDRKTADRLDHMSKQMKMPKRVLIPLMLDYFEKNGIDPSKDKSPIKEMQQVVKRVNDLWGFMKKQEQDFIKPLYHEIMTTQETNKKYHEVVKDGLSQVKNNQGILQDHITNEAVKLKNSLFTKLDFIKTLSEEEKRGLEKLLEYLDKKNKSGLLGNLFK